MTENPSSQELLLKIAALEQELTASRLRENTLTKNEDTRYQTIFEHAGVGIVHCTLDGRFLNVNPEFANFSGYTEEELKKIHVKDITFPGDIATDTQAIKDLIAGKSTKFSTDKRYLRKDGKVVWGHVTVSLMIDTVGEEAMLLATIQDIHARKTAEEVLSGTLHRYRVIFENSPLGMIRFDPSGTICDCNEKFIEIMGSTRERLIGFNTARESSPKMRATINKALAGESAVYEDGYTSVTGGKTTFIRVVFNPVTPGQSPSEVIATLEDVTDRKLAEEKLQENENRLRFALEGANDGFWDSNLLTGSVYFSERSHEILGNSSGTLTGGTKDWRTLVHPDDFPATWAHIFAHLKKQTPMLRVELRLRMLNGDWKWVLIRGKVVEWAENGRALRMTGTLTDIDNRRKLEETQMFLLEYDRSNSREDYFKALVRYLANRLQVDCACVSHLQADGLTARTKAVFQDGEFLDNLTYTLQGTPCGVAVGETICCYPEHVRQLFPSDAVLQEMAAESYVGTTLWDSQGNKIGLIAVIGRQALDSPNLAESVLKLVANRTAAEFERREAEQDRAILQNQLMQAQKMESVGRLAGGVAHDFNNMLGVILGHVEMAEEQLNPADPLLQDLHEIKTAATRSADLTRQLLAFARKQTVSPKVLDLNSTIESLLKMLRRLIGEDIDLAWLPGNGLWSVKIDPTQVDQILTNLTINARDAIAGVGRVTIETANLAIDQDYCADHMGFVPGSYVLLTVSDDGSGMDKETCEHVFEPFFTTKEVGRGTGLGLATIYGIVKQNSGFISVYSEPGKGTTFRILLPQYIGRAKIDADKPAEVVQPGQETILLVEDEPSILQLGKRMLERMGYQVLAAATPGAALQIAEQHGGDIHLLLTDVIMPEMNGRDLAKRLLSLYPKMARMFMSGYTADVIAHHGVLDEGVQFIQKPFSKAELSAKVREALNKR